MSDTPQGPGWWKASDDKWYPPEQHPDHQVGDPAAAAEPTPPPAPAVPPAPQAAAPPPAAPPGPPPAPGAAQPAEGEGGGGTGKVVVGIIAVIALIAGAFVLITQLSDDEAAASTVTLESIGSQGSNPFFASIAPEPSGSLQAFASAAAPPAESDDTTDTTDTTDEADDTEADDTEADDTVAQVGYRAVDGSVPGLYGGTLNEASCDPDQLAGLLAAEEDKAEAWAEVLEIDPNDINTYINGLTPVNLGSDTRVVNHGFRDGEATPRESILQRGTAVLVDRLGTPRVNCYSGAPLRQPQPIEGEEQYEGDQWEAFEPAEVSVVDDAASELDSFDLIDVETGQMFNRPAGSRGESDGGSTSRPATQERQFDGGIEFNREYQDSIEDDRTEASYTFDAPDGAVMRLRVANQDDSVRRISAQVTSQGSSFANFRVNPGASDEVLMVLDHDGGAEFELRFTEGPAAYSFEIEMEVQDDAGQGGDAGDDFASAFEIESGQSVEAMLGGQDSLDYFLLDLPEGGALLEFEIENARESERRVHLEVEFDGSSIENSRINPGGDHSFTYLFSGEQSGPIEIRVGEGPADYRFTAELVPQSDGSQEGDAGDSLDEARTVQPGEEHTGQVGDGDPRDYFLFEHTGGEMVLSFSNPATSPRRIHVIVEDPAGSSVANFRINPGGSDDVLIDPDQLGSEYRIIVQEGRADYTFTITSGAPAEGG